MGRLEGRIARSREHQEAMIYSMKNDQDHFQAEVRSTLTSLQSIQNHNSEKKEAGNTYSDSVVKAIAPIPSKVFDGGSMIGSPQTGQGLMGGSGFGGQGYDGNGYNGPGFGGGTGSWKYRKLDMSLFDGTDPDGWLLRVDRYFNFYLLIEEERLKTVVVALEGDALRWF